MNEPNILTLPELKSQMTKFQTELEGKVKELVGSGVSETDARVAGLKTEIGDMKKYVDGVVEQLKQTEAGKIPGLAGKEAAKFDFGMAVRLLHAEKTNSGIAAAHKECGLEREIMQAAAQKRDATGADGAYGGYLIPQEIADDVVTLAIARTPILQMGTTILKGLTADLAINRVTGRPAGYWVGENAAPTKEDTTFGQTWLRPKKAGAFSKVSNRLIYQSRGVADMIIRRELATAMGLQVNAGLTAGLGTSFQPKGILNQPNFTTSTVVCVDHTGSSTSGGRFRATDAAQMEMDLDVANELGDGGKFGYLMRPEVKSGMKRERTILATGGVEALGLPVDIMNPLMSDARLREVLGYDFKTTTQIPKNITKSSSTTLSSVVFGNWEYFYVGMWRDFVMKVSEHASDAGGKSAFTEDQLYIVCFQEVDCEVVRPTAFTVAKDAETLKANW